MLDHRPGASILQGGSVGRRPQADKTRPPEKEHSQPLTEMNIWECYASAAGKTRLTTALRVVMLRALEAGVSMLTANAQKPKSLACIALLLMLFSLSVSAGDYDHLPQLYETSSEDFVCISGHVYDAATQEALAGVGVCVFPEGIPADTSVCSGIIHENGTEYAVPALPRLHWIIHTDHTGAFAICDIPVWLSDRSFSAVIYKPAYIPGFPKAMTADNGYAPQYEQSFDLFPSES
jgi:hypothetical protein